MKIFCSACVAILLAMLPMMAHGQSTNAAIEGRITDPSKAVVPHAKIEVISTATGLRYQAESDDSGSYAFLNLPPGNYRMEVEKQGFTSIVKPDVLLHVQDTVQINFEMLLGSTMETITIEAGAPLLDTTDATVSTVVDRQFAENLPLNGRSFQSLIYLTPGVVVTPSTTYDSGQFSVNGQRASSNYWTVDGVSANIGVSPYASPGNGFGGTLGSFSALGGTNSLVSVDALQEFRIQTSTFAPEFGRTPGGQIAIVTRSGASQYHGTLFDYVRNDALDANNWFNGETNPPLPKAQESQNDFGGTFSGPIAGDKTFFFFSYEGLRLLLPQTTLTTVPDIASREAAVGPVQTYLNAFPLPNGPDLGNGVAEFNASYANTGSLDAYSLRVDRDLGESIRLFARYNYSPSKYVQRGGSEGAALSVVFPSKITTQTATLGVTVAFSPKTSDEFRFNFSKTAASSYSYIDDFGGATPPATLPFPSPFTSADSEFSLNILALTSGSQLASGQNAKNMQQQFNIVDNLAVEKGAHSFKFGLDFRRLTPVHDPILYQQQVYFLDVPSAETGSVFESAVASALNTKFLFTSVSLFAQDTWQMSRRLNLTYGIRWDTDAAPSALQGPNLLAVTGFNLNDLSQLALASSGTPPFPTTHRNFAPRVGIAYAANRAQDCETVIRGGFGVFYDLASSEAGSLISLGSYPFGALGVNIGGNFPLSSQAAAPPPITESYLSSPFGTLGAFDPHFQLPYTLEWNVAVQQSLGSRQTLTASYIGALGRRLIQSAYVVAPNASFGSAYLVGNFAESNYNALQWQFQRQLAGGLQALASYTWSHSIDDASAGSVFGNEANAATPGVNPSANRASSDFDIRQAVSAGLTYELPKLNRESFWSVFADNWSLDSFFLAHTAPPVTITDATFSTLFNGYTAVRPDIVPGVPFYVYGAECVAALGVPCPGGKGFNPAAFTNPPVDPATGLPLRQGDLPRNALRGFGAWQWDFAVHRDFPLREGMKLQFRGEMFNVLNHPNFAQPSAAFGAGGFGVSNQMLGQSLGGNNIGGGAFSPLYQLGGPRSIQLALKLFF